MISKSVFLRWQIWLVVILGFFVPLEAYAAFNGLVPLSHSGRISYAYFYADNAGSESETTSLQFGWNASGYIWRPWFVTTSMALNVGLVRTDSTSSSTEGTTGTGNFSLGVFSRSRFPFSISYAQTDSRSQQFFDVTQLAGETSFRVTRLTLRQSYLPRRHNQLFNGWYNSTQFDGGTFGSNSQGYGLDYSMRASQQTVSATVTHFEVNSGSSASESTTDIISVSHVYTPSAELGVNSLFSYVETDPGGGGTETFNSQAFSSFFWRPEHRSVNVSGGVRLSESKSESASSKTVTSGLNTNLGVGYKVTRSLNMSAGMSLGTSDNESSQLLTTTQVLNVSYSGDRRQWRGVSHFWQWGAGGSNAVTRTDPKTGPERDSTSRQNTGVTMSLGHNLTKTWAMGRSSSLSGTFSQSGSGSKNSVVSTINKTLNHSVSVGWNTRGRRGATYINSRLSDSRSFGAQKTVFNNFGLNYTTNLTINRLSSMTGNANYEVSRNTSENDMSGGSTKNLTGGLGYRNNRPFGIYNLSFTSRLQGRRQIDTPLPSTTLQWESIFRYQLGLLSTTLGFRASESAGGNLAKSMNFQATRTF